MDWPAFSPDFNPIEDVWDALGRRLVAQLHPLWSIQKLKQMLIEELTLLLQELLDNLALRTERQSKATIAIRGGHIPY
ncbi:transposable element Tc1 transposase [Trichonephila clavipes]|nr:transposable element Tc1 transposase [Trichonephila clavipes]